MVFAIQLLPYVVLETPQVSACAYLALGAEGSCKASVGINTPCLRDVCMSKGKKYTS